MGQIIIDTPGIKTIHYELENGREYDELLQYLERLCLIANPSDEYLTDEDLEDIRLATDRLENGEFITWEEAKVFLDR